MENSLSNPIPISELQVQNSRQGLCCDRPKREEARLYDSILTRSLYENEPDWSSGSACCAFRGLHNLRVFRSAVLVGSRRIGCPRYRLGGRAFFRPFTDARRRG